MDPYRNEYYYLTNDNHYIIISKGKDRIFNTEDDYYKIIEKSKK